MTLEALKQAIAALPVEEKIVLATWLNEQEIDQRDRQIQKDFAPGGPGIRLVKKVKADISAGKFTPMDDKRT
jgi:hypothetical protein